MNELLDLPSAVWRPLVFQPRDLADQQMLAQLRAEGSVRETFDTIQAQLRDLASVRHPRRKLKPDELTLAVTRLLGDIPPEDYGRWVFYPWSGRLVHLLAADEFREVRVNRNQNKITVTEQARLGEVTVGVVGLSVGNAVARTLALEGIGSLKLADFDQLDLSNLNRLQAGVHELGLNKAVLAARQILELDPDARVQVFPGGVTEENLDEFLQATPRVDVLVDECDSLDVKVLLRERARHHRLPVLMETSDRGMLDVERFDQEPDRPIFHGQVGNLRAADLRQLVMEQKVVHVLNIIGASTMSTRLGASLVEIERTISTWPQLGSDVTLGGATIAAATRRIALNEPLASGRRYVDLARVLDSEPLQPAPGKGVVPLKSEPSHPSGVSPFLHFLVEHAVLAPSGGNCQPWRFYAEGEDRIHLIHDSERSRNLLDGTRLASCIALGAAIENMVVAAAHRGFDASVESFPSPGNPAWVATVRLAPARAQSDPRDEALFEALTRRVTNRRNADPTPLDTVRAQELVAAAKARGGHLELQVNRAALDEVGQILGEADRVRFLCDKLHREVMSELRWDSRETETTRDGIDLATLELTQSEAAVMQVLARPDIAAFLRKLDGGVALTEGASKSIQGACAVGLIRVRDEDPGSFLEAGRAIQRTWLMATKLGLGFQPMTALLFLFRMFARPEADIFLERERRVLRDLEVRLDGVFSARTDLSRAMLFRLTNATEVTARALRRPVSEVLHRGRPE